MTPSPVAADHLPIPSETIANLESTWEQIASPGASFTGDQRVAIAAEARRSREGPMAGFPAQDGVGLPPAAAEAARRLAAAPHTIRRDWVQEVVQAGIGDAGYVEIVGVVSRLVATDTFIDALGLHPVPLPDPRPGTPTGEVADRARRGAGWVPMVGVVSITQALSLVPAENAALERYHGSMYLTFEEMSDPGVTRHSPGRRWNSSPPAHRRSTNASTECWHMSACSVGAPAQ